MGHPRIYPPDISQARRREQRRRFNIRERTILELFRERHPRLYNRVVVDAEEIVNSKEGPLPGSKENQ